MNFLLGLILDFFLSNFGSGIVCLWAQLEMKESGLIRGYVAGIGV